MTKEILLTSVKEMVAVKLSCKCGFVIQFPVSVGYQKVQECISCGRKFPANEVAVFMDSVKTIQRFIKPDGDFSGIDVVFETSRD